MRRARLLSPLIAMAFAVTAVGVTESISAKDKEGGGGGGGQRSGGGGGERSRSGGGGGAVRSAPQRSAPQTSRQPSVRSEPRSQGAQRSAPQTSRQPSVRSEPRSQGAQRSAPRPRQELSRGQQTARPAQPQVRRAPENAARPQQRYFRGEQPTRTRDLGSQRSQPTVRQDQPRRADRDRDQVTTRSRDERVQRPADSRRGQGEQARQATRPDPRRLGLSLSESEGRALRIGNVDRDGAASKLGLREGDEVVSLGGQKVASRGDFDQALQQSARNRDRDRDGRDRDGRDRDWRDRDGDRDGRNWDRDRDWRVPIVVRRGGSYYTLYWPAIALGLAGYGHGGYGRYYDPGYARSGYYYDDGYYDDSYSTQPAAPQYADQGAFLGVVLDPRYSDAAVVQEVYSNSPAEEAGLRPGDRILSINSQQVNSSDDLINLINQMQPGQPVEIRYSRNRSTGNVQVELGDRSESTEAPGPSD